MSLPYMAQSTFWWKGDWGIGKKSTFWEQIGVSADDLKVVSTSVEGEKLSTFRISHGSTRWKTKDERGMVITSFGEGGIQKYVLWNSRGNSRWKPISWNSFVHSLRADIASSRNCSASTSYSHAFSVVSDNCVIFVYCLPMEYHKGIAVGHKSIAFSEISRFV